MSERRRCPKIPKWSPVIVHWRDAVTVHDPMHSDSLEDAEPVVRRSLGFLLASNKKTVTIAMEDDRDSHDPDRDCQTVTSLTKSMVIKIERLTPEVG